MNTTLSLSPWEINYLANLLADQEVNLFSGQLVEKMRSAQYDLAARVIIGASARKSDPHTSKAAGASAAMRAGSQKHILLQAYADLTAGLTDEEAGHNSGLARKPKCCYWKRCSELRQAGLIAVTGETRASSVGEQQQVCAITEAGLLALSKN